MISLKTINTKVKTMFAITNDPVDFGFGSGKPLYAISFLKKPTDFLGTRVKFVSCSKSMKCRPYGVV